MSIAWSRISSVCPRRPVIVLRTRAWPGVAFAALVPGWFCDAGASVRLQCTFGRERPLRASLRREARASRAAEGRHLFAKGSRPPARLWILLRAHAQQAADQRRDGGKRIGRSAHVAAVRRSCGEAAGLG